MISGVFERLEDFCLAMSNPQPNLISDDAPIYHHLRWAEAKLMLGRLASWRSRKTNFLSPEGGCWTAVRRQGKHHRL